MCQKSSKGDGPQTRKKNQTIKKTGKTTWKQALNN